MFDGEEAKTNLKVVAILNEVSFCCFKYECNLIPIDIGNWEHTIVNEKPDLLLVESAWHSSINLYNLHKNQSTSSDDTLQKILNLCKSRNIPTIFWNTEDPFHFELFIDSAKLFDYIFTIDYNSIQKYKAVVGHENVFLLNYAAQPRIHNPIEMNRYKLGRITYIGTWNRAYPEMLKDLDMLLRTARKLGLHIYDTMQNLPGTDYYRYPDIYKSYIKGSYSNEQISSIYKKYNIVLNAEKSKSNPTAFSREVYEALASGISVVSSYSAAIENTFPGIVKLCKTDKEVVKCIDILLKNVDFRDRLSLLGQREVLRKHTYRHRIEDILDKVGIANVKDSMPGVSVIVCTNRQWQLNNVFENYNRQNYERKELIIVLNNNSMNSDEWIEKAKQYKDVRVFKLDEGVSLGECLNFAISQSSMDYISKFDDDDYYAPEYLHDSLTTFKYTNADVVGKHGAYVYFEKNQTLAIASPDMENCYSGFLRGGTITAKRKIFQRIQFAHVSLGEDLDFFEKCINSGISIYSSDRFNYVYIRYSSASEHTWKISDDEMMQYCTFITDTSNYIPYITV